MSNRSSAPAVHIEDSDDNAVEFGPKDIKRLVAEAIQENPAVNMDELRQMVREELSKMDMDPGLMQEAVMKQLNMALHGQAQNFAERAANDIKEDLREEFKAYQESQKWSTTKKVCVVGGTAATMGIVYYVGRRNGRKIGSLENG